MVEMDTAMKKFIVLRKVRLELILDLRSPCRGPPHGSKIYVIDPKPEKIADPRPNP